MLLKCSHSELVDIGQLKSHPKNPNVHPPDQIERLSKLIEHHGFRHPIIISKRSGFIVAGHGRLQAAKLLGLKKVPVDYQDFDSDDAEYAFLVSDNAIAEWADLDLAAINFELPNLGPDFDINMLGIKDFVLEPIEKLEPQCDEDDVPELKGEPKTKLGDIYVLGDHRLLCADSTDIGQVERLLNGNRADMIYTDPPYGMRLNTQFESMGSKKRDFDLTCKSHSYKPVIGDSEDYDPTWLIGYFQDARELFLWGCDYYAERIPNRNSGSWIVWDKTGGHETLDKIFASNFELCWSRERHKREVSRITWKGAAGMKPHDGGSRVHPTQKPVDLAIWFFEHWGKPNENVIDLFGGSGSTLIACEKTNRKCLMMELDPHYCDIIVSRYLKYTGKKKVIRNGEEIEWDTADIQA